MRWPYPAEYVQNWYETFRSFVESADASGYAAREDRQLIITGGGAITWNGTTGIFTWASPIKIVSPITGFQVQVAAGQVTITDGQVIYLSLTRAPTRIVTATIRAATQVPSTDIDYVLATRIGAKLYWRNGLMLDTPASITDIGSTQGGGGGSDPNAIHDNVDGEIVLIGEKVAPVAADLVIIEDSENSYTKKRAQAGNLPGGASLASTPPVNVTKATAATGTGTTAARDDHKHDVTTAAAGAATPGDAATEGSATSLARSDHQHSLPAYGSSAGTFCEGNDARLSDARTPTGAAGGDLGGTYPTPTVNDGADSTAIHDNVAAEINAIASKASPIGADKLLIEDSEDATTWAKKSILISALPSGVTTDRRTSVIIVGNSVNGDTAADCDYLDSGDGVQLVTALAAAGAGKDVYIRPGTYNLGAGAAVAPLVVPASVRVRGAGRLHTKITTKTSGDQGAFTLAADSILEDLGINVGLPTGSGSGSTSVVFLNGARAKCKSVSVDFPGTWTSTEAGYTVLRSVFKIGDTAAPPDCLLDDCWAGQHNGVPSLISLGLSGGNEMACFRIPQTASPTWFAALIVKAQTEGGDWAVMAGDRVKVALSSFYDMYLRGVIISGSDASGSEVVDNHIHPLGSAGTEIGVLLNAATQVGVQNNYIEFTTPTSGQYAISLTGADNNTVTGNRGPGGLAGAASLDVSSDNNIVTANQFNGASYNDLGSANDAAHNK